MAEPFVAVPACAVCGRPTSRVELIAPGGRPAEWDRWSAERRDSFTQAVARAFTPAGAPGPRPGWWLLFSGVAAGNGNGDPVDVARAERLTRAFRRPYRYAAVREADFYDDAGFCGECDAPYCYTHWHPSATEYGRCPQGHGRSLDPFWYPCDG